MNVSKRVTFKGEYLWEMYLKGEWVFCRYSPVSIDVPTIRAGITAGREAVMHVFEPMVATARQKGPRARALSAPPRVSSNVVPVVNTNFTSGGVQPGEAT